MSDDIHSPAHYAEGRAIEPIDAIEDWNMSYHLGTVIKYLSRAGRKDDYLKDLRKANWFLNREISRAERLEMKVKSGGRHALLVGDQVRCIEGDDTDFLTEGAEYRVAQVQNGHEFSFVVLAGLPTRYVNAERFELVQS